MPVDSSQKLMADVYNVIRGNEALWNKCLFLITYDEHGEPVESWLAWSLIRIVVNLV
jgi:hypothetical protein